MVENKIRLRSLSTGELTGIINIYPWFGAARKELCRRLAREGKASGQQFAEMALHVPAREKIYRLLRGVSPFGEAVVNLENPLRKPARTPARKPDAAPAAPAPEPDVAPVPSRAEPVRSQASPRIAGGDYFSQAEYARVREGGDRLLDGLRFKARKEASDEKPTRDIADRFQTEALAEIFAEQGYPDLAKRIYSKLILVYPEKSAYFASLIEKLD